jgi:hypothetical protein
VEISTDGHIAMCLPTCSFIGLVKNSDFVRPLFFHDNAIGYTAIHQKKIFSRRKKEMANSTKEAIGR